MSTVVANWAGVSNFLFCSALCGMLVSGLYVSKSECSFQNFRLQINHSCCDLRFFRALKLVSRYTCHDLDTHGSHFVHTCLMCEATAGIKRLLFFPRRTTVNCWVFSSGQQAFMYILGWSLQKARFCFRPKLSAETHLKTFILSGPLYFLYIKGASLAGLSRMSTSSKKYSTRPILYIWLAARWARLDPSGRCFLFRLPVLSRVAPVWRLKWP
jgi:hypothetical protein